MENPPAVPAERETIAAAGALVVAAVDLQTGIVAEQKGADGAVADKENISRPVSTEDLFGLLQDPPLRIDRALPAPDTGERIAEELIGHRLELFGVQETCRRTVVLVHGLADLQRNVHLACDDFRRLDRLPLAARDDLGRARKSSGIRKGDRTRPAGRAQSPRGDRDGRIDRDLRVGQITDEAGHAGDDEAIPA